MSNIRILFCSWLIFWSGFLCPCIESVRYAQFANYMKDIAEEPQNSKAISDILQMAQNSIDKLLRMKATTLESIVKEARTLSKFVPLDFAEKAVEMARKVDLKSAKRQLRLVMREDLSVDLNNMIHRGISQQRSLLQNDNSGLTFGDQVSQVIHFDARLFFMVFVFLSLILLFVAGQIRGKFDFPSKVLASMMVGTSVGLLYASSYTSTPEIAILATFAAFFSFVISFVVTSVCCRFCCCILRNSLSRIPLADSTQPVPLPSRPALEPPIRVMQMVQPSVYQNHQVYLPEVESDPDLPNLEEFTCFICKRRTREATVCCNQRCHEVCRATEVQVQALSRPGVLLKCDFCRKPVEPPYTHNLPEDQPLSPDIEPLKEDE